ncbi:MAG: Rpn family recombination-promoting nuclease/putative transposase, partial [Propionibacteriaceae bacterium]|nr:Rpn family recombination-promoting nuclease/putative transposase [Propionibacteriaceae bacterium]
MTTPKLIAPTNDLLFKKTLASEDHKTILQGFVHDFFGLQVALEDLVIQNPYSIQAFDRLNPDHPDAQPGSELRQTLYDVAATCPAGDVLTELQIRHETNYTLRAVYYAFTDYTAHYNLPHATSPYGRPDRYSSLIPVHTMNIIGFNLFDGPHPLTRLRLLDPDNGRRLTPDPLTIGFFELRKPVPENDFNLKCWRHYWRTGRALKDAPAYIHEAAGIIGLVNLTEQERAMITAQERQRDKLDGML